MKCKGGIVSLVLLFTSVHTNAQLFNQNFDSSSILTDYFSVTPTSNQFRNISTTNETSEVKIADNKLFFRRLGASTTVAYAERNVDFASSPSALKIQFNFLVSGGSAGTNVFALAVGSDVVNSGTPPTISNLFGRISFNTTINEGEFKIRDVTNGKTGNNTYSGSQNILWVLNNSGGTLSYLAPNGNYESIEDNKADIWVGTTKEFDEIIVDNPNQNLSRFKFYTNSSWTVGSAITIDDIIIENESALPVQLTYFNGLLLNKEVVLSWQTATEINNYGFDIEKRVLGTNLYSEGWQKISFVQGHGNSNSPKKYSFTDILKSTNFYLPAMLQYRLKQIDFDGQFEYSDIVEVNINGVQQFILEQNYPNPFNPETTIKYSVPSGVETSYPEESGQVMTSLRVYDILGREIATLVNEAKLPGNYSIKFSIKEFDKEKPLSNSIYFYKLQAGNFIQVKKMILMK
jgi:hypothetical protein